MTSVEKRKSIENLEGETLTGVCFVQDYVEFHFHDQVPRSLSNPILKEEKLKVRFPEAGSRDRFCSLIGATVDRVVIEDVVSIQIILGGAVITVSLDLASR